MRQAGLISVTVSLSRDGKLAEEAHLVQAVPRKGETVVIGTQVAMVTQVRHFLRAGSVTVVAE